jgi:hypothetical protein
MWLLKELGIVALFLAFLTFAGASRLLPPSESWWPGASEVTLWIAGFCAYAAGAISMISIGNRSR